MAFFHAFYGKVFDRHRYTQFPIVDNQKMWKECYIYTFAETGNETIDYVVAATGLKYLPKVFSIVTGKMSWVGYEPHKHEELVSMGEDWINCFKAEKMGLYSLSYVNYCRTGIRDKEMIYCSDMYYAAMRGPRMTCKILLTPLLKS